jgi:hypothetical protein
MGKINLSVISNIFHPKTQNSKGNKKTTINPYIKK